jgi:hypothetical protein
MARTHEVIKTFTHNFYQSNNAMEEYDRKNKVEIHKELQDPDLLGSPHMEERLIGRNIDLDLLSIFSQEDARIIGGIEIYIKLEKVNNGG